jgi:hypothetical protein
MVKKKSWLEVGVGPARVLKADDSKSVRVVMRREATPGGLGTKLILNLKLTAGGAGVITTRQSENTFVIACPDPVTQEPSSYLIRTKTAKESTKFFSIIETGGEKN